MKTIQNLILFLVVLIAASELKAVPQDNLSKSLASIKEKVKDVTIDKSTYKQSIDILDEAKGKISFTSTIADEKGKTTGEKFEFYVSDIDRNTIIRKTSGKKLFISLTINNNQKFIKHFREEKLDSYTSNLEILMSSSDEATVLSDLIKNTIPLVKTADKSYNTNKDALNWLKDNISKISSGQTTIEQSFSYGERKDYLASYTVKKTDQKSISTEEKYEFSLLDINIKNLTVKVSGTQLFVSVETRGNDSFIKYFKNNELQSFQNNFEIVADDIDQARNIVAALSSAIDKSKQVIPDFGTLQKSLDFITKNTIDFTSEKKTINQKISFSSGNGTKTVFTYAEPDSKGKAVEERYEFWLCDIDANTINFKVSGKKISIGFMSANKTKFLRYFKDNILLDFQNAAYILVSDIETAREMSEALKAAIKGSEVKPLTWKNNEEAVAFLAAALTGVTIGTDTYKPGFSTMPADPLKMKFMTGKTDAKGISTEQSLEFYPYMLDPASAKFTSSGKYLNVEFTVNGKKEFIRSLKDGKQQGYTEVLEIMAFDSKQAREIADAIKFLAINAKPKDKTWGDKQAAIKFITENVTDMKNEEKLVKQKVESDGTDPCKISFKVSGTDDKGKTTDEIYEFTLSDMNSQLVEMKVAGRILKVILPCRNKEKLVKVYKNGVQQAWGTTAEIELGDVETAKNVATAFKSAITMCQK